MKVVLLTLLATFAMQAGLLLWKLSSQQLPRIGDVATIVAVKAFLSNPRWLLGWLATTIGWLLLIKAMDLGELTIVQPLMALGQLLLVGVAVMHLGERLKGTEWGGIALTALGTIVLGVEAETSEPDAIVWQGLVLLLAVVSIGTVGLLASRRRTRAPELPLAVAVGLSFGTAAVLTELLTASLSLQGHELESLTMLTHPALAAMIAANIAGIVLLQAAFQRGRLTVVVPINLAVTNALGVLGGALVFGETISLRRLLAIAAVVTGTAMLYRFSRSVR